MSNKTIGDVISELVNRSDIDIYILERALAQRCYPDRTNEYLSVEVDNRLACDSPGRQIERQQTEELLARVEKTLAETAKLLGKV